MTTLYVLRTPPAPGWWNMALDAWLLHRAAEEGLAVLRWYSWSEPTLSLGYFQRFADRTVDTRTAAIGSLPVVRRVSGGGALVHDRELTYSIAIPASDPLAGDRMRLYSLFHRTLIDTLVSWGVAAELYGNVRRNTDEDRKTNVEKSVAIPPGNRREPFLCFERRTDGDVVLYRSRLSFSAGRSFTLRENKLPNHRLREISSDFGLPARSPGTPERTFPKIAGSAQYRQNGGLLQHGSVLLSRSPTVPHLEGIKEITGVDIPIDRLSHLWEERVATAFAATILPYPWNTRDDMGVERIATQRHRQNAWISKR